MTKTALPKAVASESRIAFALKWFATEAEADEYAAYVREQGWTYVGGFLHGTPCGRAPHFDRVDDDGRKLYAVTE